MTKGGTISLGCRGLTKDPGPLDEEAKLGCSHAQHLPLDRARASTQGTPVSPDLRANSKINAVTTLLLGKRVLTRLMAPDRGAGVVPEHMATALCRRADTALTFRIMTQREPDGPRSCK